MPTINDPNGQPAYVNVKGKVLVCAVTSSMASHACADEEHAYTAIIGADPSATDADIFYLKNTGTSLLRIHRIRSIFPPTVSSLIYIKIGVTGTPTSGSTLTPVNKVAGSGNIPDCTCEQRDGDMALTGGSILETLSLVSTAVGEQTWEYDPPIILKPNQALVFNNVTDPTSDFTMAVDFFFHDAV